MKPKITVFIILSLLSISYGQRGVFWEFNTSRYARVISLGNAFTGLADDIETVYYNSAGLANLDYYAVSYSNGQGFAFVTNDYTANNFSIILPSFRKIGIFALSVDRLHLSQIDYGQSIYRIHYARNIFNNISIGTSLDYYHSHIGSYTNVSLEDVDDDIYGNALDVSLSALYSFPMFSIPGIMNQTGFGIQMQNLFDTKLHYTKNLDSSDKHQILRLGLSNSITPKFPKLLSLVPLKIIVVADAVFYGSDYEFEVWQPNYGLEFALMEVFKFRFGRENEKEIDSFYESSPQHPVKRYGLGLVLPFHKFITKFDKFEVAFDYSYSDWDKLDESKPFLGYDLPVRESFSFKFSFLY